MRDVEGDTWAILDRDAVGQQPLDILLKAIRATESTKDRWLFWGASGGSFADHLLPEHDPIAMGFASIDPERLIEVVEDRSVPFDWLLLRDSTQRSEFGVFDSSFLFVRASDPFVSRIKPHFGRMIRLSPAPGPIMRIWTRAASR